MAASSTFAAVDGAGYETLMGRWSRRLAVPFVDFVGVAAGSANKRLARLRCGGGDGVAVRAAEYRGLETCAAAAAVAGGGLGCSWACIGLADC